MPHFLRVFQFSFVFRLPTTLHDGDGYVNGLWFRRGYVISFYADAAAAATEEHASIIRKVLEKKDRIKYEVMFGVRSGCYYNHDDDSIVCSVSLTFVLPGLL